MLQVLPMYIPALQLGFSGLLSTAYPSDIIFGGLLGTVANLKV